MARNYIIYIGLILFPFNAWGQCDQETVQFYLEKGFTQEQITKLCSSSTTSAPKYEPYQKPVVIYQEAGTRPGQSAEERKAEKEIKGSIAGRSVEVLEDSINYIRAVCLVAGNNKEVDQRGKKCVDVAYSIARKDLRVLESGRGFLLFGDIELEVVSSEIKRKTVTADPWNAFPPDVRFAFKRKFEQQEQGNKTTIPIRTTASAGQVVNALKTLAASTAVQDSGHDSEVARILDESYVAPSEEEYAKTLPKDPDVVAQEEAKENKKKRWGTPFD